MRQLPDMDPHAPVYVLITDIMQHQAEENDTISVKTAAKLATNITYENKDMLQAGLIIAGWDKHEGGTVWGIPLGGTIMKAPYAIGGSGSAYIYGFMDRCATRFQQARQKAGSNPSVRGVHQRG